MIKQTLGIPIFPAYTWAGKPSASAVGAGFIIRVTDLGENGALLISNGTRWRPLNGQVSLKTLQAASANVGNTETIVLQTQIPAGGWQQYDTLRFWLDVTKNGAVDAANLCVRIGTAGTVADTAISDLGPFAALAAGQQAGGFILDVKQMTSTTATHQGNNTAGAQSYSNGGSTVGSSPTVISDASANALWVTVTLQSAGTTNTVQLTSGQIQLVTP